MCLCYFSLSSVSFSQLFLNFSRLNVSILCLFYFFLFVDGCIMFHINEMLSSVCFLNTLLLFDESKWEKN